MGASRSHLEAKERIWEEALERAQIASRRRDLWERLSVYPILGLAPAIIGLLEQCDAVDILESRLEGRTLILIENTYLWFIAVAVVSLLLVVVAGFFRRHATRAERRAYTLRDAAWRDWQQAKETHYD